MLSDHERKTLRAVERQFMAEDPEFPRSFDDMGRYSTYSLQWMYTMPRWVYTVAIMVAVALSVVMLVAGATGTALVLAVLATMISVVQRHRDEPGRGET